MVQKNKAKTNNAESTESIANTAIQSVNFRKNFIWNLIGSTASAFVSLFLMMVVTRINGVDDAGIFSFAFSTASLFLIIGVYSGRTFQVTDTNKKTNDSDYFYAKFTTCFVMLVMALIFCFLRKYDLEKSTVVIFLVLYRISEAISESCFAIIQKKDRLYQVGRSSFMKTTLSLISFIFVDCLTGNLVLTCSTLVLAHCLVLFLYDLPRVARTGFKMQKIAPKKVWYILKIGFFAFGFSILNQYIVNISRFAIDSVGTNEDQTIFSILVMPASVLVLSGQYLIQPLLTTMKRTLGKNITSFIQLIIKICLIIFGFGGVCVLMAWSFGIPVLEALYAVELDDYLMALLVILLGGILLAVLMVLSTALTVMRQTGGQLVCYLVACVIAYLFSTPLVSSLGVFGGCLAYFFAIVLVLVLYVVLFIFEVKKFSQNFAEEVKRAAQE